MPETYLSGLYNDVATNSIESFSNSKKKLSKLSEEALISIFQLTLLMPQLRYAYYENLLDFKTAVKCFQSRNKRDSTSLVHILCSKQKQEIGRLLF